jgi:acyl-CoA reductase-like NAD-dependent aldehyde dehydrogenase
LHALFNQVVSSLNLANGSSGENLRDQIDANTFQVFMAKNETTALAVSDSRLATLSFTGSDLVGWGLRDTAKKKKVCLELGGDAAVIVHRDADLARAAARCAWGAFVYAGQICISIQRIFVHQDVWQEFVSLFLEQTKKLETGDPHRDATLIGPVIDERAAERIVKWVGEAQQKGAQTLYEGPRNGRLISPIVLANVPTETQMSCNEVFGPVVALESYANEQEVFARVNSSRFGLQAGIFTQNLHFANTAYQTLEVGGVIVNDIPTYRSDWMPYGGVKDSGLGREGVKFAAEEFSESRLRVDWHPFGK